MPYDLETLHQRIHVLVDNDPDTPPAGDDEYVARTRLIHQAISEWELMDVDWDELWTSATEGTISAGTTEYALGIDDMRRPGGFLTLEKDGTSSRLEIISPEESQKYQNARVVWFTGNNEAGWTLNLGWTPDSDDWAVGATIKFPYYKYAALPENPTDVVEMSDPNFIIYRVAATKAVLESKNNLYSVYSTEALNCMDRMKTMNFLNPNYQRNEIEDQDNILNGAIIGL